MKSPVIDIFIVKCYILWLKKKTVAPKTKVGWFSTHHAEELLRQRVVGQEVELGGMRGEGGVGRRGVVEPRPQGQVVAQQLHLVLDLLQRLPSLWQP